MSFGSVKARAVTAGRFGAYCLRRFRADGCLAAAGALSYSTLLALVPLLAMGLGIFSLFPAFDGLRVELERLILLNLLPDVGSDVGAHISRFVRNARQSTGPSLVVLIATSLLLLSTITESFNAIWRATEPQPLIARLIAYWAILTFGPLLIGASISLSSYGFAMAEWLGVDTLRYSVGLGRLLPLLLTTVGITVLYAVGPGRRVRLGHALIGALIAAVLFEALKAGIGLYFRAFPSYQAIYGAIAAIPLFLVWMYLSWLVVLSGAEIAASLPEWRSRHHLTAEEHGPGVRLALALAILQRLRAASLEGEAIREPNLVKALPASVKDLESVLAGLRRSRLATRAGSRWVLSRDLRAVSLDDLMRALRITLEPGRGWPKPIHALVSALDDATAAQRHRPLAELIDEISPSHARDQARNTKDH